MRIALFALALVTGTACTCRSKAAKQEEPAPPARGETTEHSAPPPPSLETTTVTGAGVVPAVGLGPKITFTKTELKLDEENIATVGPDGLIDPTRLAHLTRQLEAKANSDAPVAVMLDQTIEYHRIAKFLDVLRKGGFRNLALLTGTGSHMIPIELPDSAELGTKGVRPVVTVEGKYVRVWSASGEEGTQKKPKLAMEVAAAPDFKPITRALAEIVQRRWPSGKRPPEDLTIIVQLDGKQTAQTLLSLLAAVRADGSLVLFPNIFLAGGI